MLGRFADRLLVPVATQSATKLLLQQQLPAHLPTALNNSARMLALQAMEFLRIPLPEDRWTPVPKQRTGAAGRSQNSMQRRAA